MKFFLETLLLAIWTNLVACQSDYIDAVPATIYEADAISPQNLDYDKENKIFPAHKCWLNDKMIHYYKFRIFAPATYPGVIDPVAPSAADVPLQKLYIATTTPGSLDGAVGRPILQYHTSDGSMYSDFMEIVTVTVDDAYTTDMYKSEGDIMASGADTQATGMVLNIPVVPTGARLQHPTKGTTDVAPINPTPVFYKGQEVWTYVFEVTGQGAADYFASTRTSKEDGFAITVKKFASAESVSAIPLWHTNQFLRGVEPGQGGGPYAGGMRNIINLDRPDAGYSPLWHLQWVTEVPVNYNANEASNIGTLTEANGFKFVQTPMFVNCPDIGAVGTENPDKLDSFQLVIDRAIESNILIGSHKSLILEKGETVAFKSNDGTMIGQVETTIMGGYEYSVDMSKVPANATSIDVYAKGIMIRSVFLKNVSTGSGDNVGDQCKSGNGLFRQGDKSCGSK